MILVNYILVDKKGKYIILNEFFIKNYVFEVELNMVFECSSMKKLINGYAIEDAKMKL